MRGGEEKKGLKGLTTSPFAVQRARKIACSWEDVDKTINALASWGYEPGRGGGRWPLFPFAFSAVALRNGYKNISGCNIKQETRAR